MEDITRIECFVPSIETTEHEMLIIKAPLTERDGQFLPVTAATLFISKDDKPPKVFTEEDLERAWKEFGMGGSDLQRDFMYILRNLPEPNDK